MTLYIVWVHTFYKTRNKNSFGNWTIDDIMHATTPPQCHLATHFFKIYYCMHYMILMSEKMTSQKKLGEIKSVPYNKPLSHCHWQSSMESKVKFLIHYLTKKIHSGEAPIGLLLQKNTSIIDNQRLIVNNRTKIRIIYNKKGGKSVKFGTLFLRLYGK